MLTKWSHFLLHINLLYWWWEEKSWHKNYSVSFLVVLFWWEKPFLRHLHKEEITTSVFWLAIQPSNVIQISCSLQRQIKACVPWSCSYQFFCIMSLICSKQEFFLLPSRRAMTMGRWKHSSRCSWHYLWSCERHNFADEKTQRELQWLKPLGSIHCLSFSHSLLLSCFLSLS